MCVYHLSYVTLCYIIIRSYIIVYYKLISAGAGAGSAAAATAAATALFRDGAGAGL